MSFLTDVTPPAPRATSTALLISARDVTTSLNCTVPLKVSTLISAGASEGCYVRIVFLLKSPFCALAHIQRMTFNLGLHLLRCSRKTAIVGQLS